MANISNDRLYSLKNEIKMAEAINREELEPILYESIQRYMGNYVPALGANWDIVLNEIYPIIQNNLPAIFFKNPRVFLKPRNPTFIAKKRNPLNGQMEETELDSMKSAKTQESILNYLLEEINYKKEVRRTLLDALLFPYGVLWHGYKGDFGMTEEKSIVIKNDSIFVKRTMPLRFIKDPAVNISDIEEADWIGRIIDIPLNDLLEDDKLDVDKKQIKGFKGFGNKIGKRVDMSMEQGKDLVPISHGLKNLLDFTDHDYRDSKDSRYVRLYEIFLRPSKKEKRKGENGLILLITEEQEKPLRVNDWKIKAEGFPAKILEFNELNDNLFGMADIDTYKSIADHKNVIVNLQLRNAQENTKNWVGISKEGANEEDITKVQQGDNTIITFESGNPRDRMFVASPGGGASSELYIIDQRIQKNLEDKSGVTDLKRGFLQSGEESAASVKLRAAGGSARPAYRQDLMSDFLKSSTKYLNQLTKQFLPFTKAVRIVGSLDIEWSENYTKEEIQAETDVEIDVISMLPENPEEELRRLNETLALMIQGLRIPEVKQKLLEEGKTINLSPIIEQILLRQRIRNPDVFRNIKAEESQGFVSVAEIRAAKANVEAALQGNPNVPSPPQVGQDHVARIETYSTILGLIQSMGDSIAARVLGQLIQIHQALIEDAQSKQPNVGQNVSLKQPVINQII